MLPSDQALVIKPTTYFRSYHRRRQWTARRIADACALPSTDNLREAIEDVENQLKRSKLHYLELNAVSARLASEMAVQSDEPTTATGRGRGCHFLDGGIILGAATKHARLQQEET
ncbi:hypothetical protein PENFLA_c003G03641 [Penicillium flavigenum]|uniref:Uncharacterized protein n=1 Tax=Penicillium flavigenum TaxID=254877 RepID=A0A1V6TWX8_9EURO|nr:hypothetical protein PENFLA_c003G03641 [Penicillium flavigenum]